MNINRKRFCLTFVTAVVATFCIDTLTAKDAPQRGVRFDSPGVLDLADREKVAPLTRDVAVVAMSLDDAERVGAAPALSSDQATLSFSDDEFGCKPPSQVCSKAAERKRLDASNGAAKRDGTKLAIASGSTPTVFNDWKMAESKSADGDGETHWYLGALKGSGYERVEVQFEHDSPGDFLINAANGKIAFVHNGSDVVALSPDGLSVLTDDTLNAPTSIRIASLDKNGPSIAVQCHSKPDDRTHVELKGWRDANSVELAIVSHGERTRLAQATGIRLQKNGADWQLATANPDRLSAIGFACRD